MDMQEGWTKRYNMLICLINEGKSCEGLNPPLDEREIEWFNERKKALDEEEANEYVQRIKNRNNTYGL